MRRPSRKRGARQTREAHKTSACAAGFGPVGVAGAGSSSTWRPSRPWFHKQDVFPDQTASDVPPTPYLHVLTVLLPL